MSSCQASSNDTTLYKTLPHHAVWQAARHVRIRESKQQDNKHAQKHTRRQQYDCQRDNSQASRQTHCRQDATACTQQHILQSGKPTPDRHQIAQQRANKPLNSMSTIRSTTRSACSMPTTQDDAHTQHAYSRHEDNNTKTASQTTSNHAVSQTNVRYGTVQMTTMTASSHPRYIASDDGFEMSAEFPHSLGHAPRRRYDAACHTHISAATTEPATSPFIHCCWHDTIVACLSGRVSRKRKNSCSGLVNVLYGFCEAIVSIPCIPAAH